MIRTGTKLALSVAVLATGIGFASLMAQDTKTKTEAKAETKRLDSAKAKPLAQIAAAYELAALGKERKSPELLIAAAIVIGSADVEEGKAKSSEVQKAAKFDGKAEAEELLKEAIKVSDNDAGVEKSVAKARREIAEAKRSPRGGPRSYSGIFQSGPADPDDTYNVDMFAGPFSFGLQSFTGTDLDIEISGPGYHRVWNSTSPSEFGSDFLPQPGEYRFRVINFNPNAFSRYNLFIN